MATIPDPLDQDAQRALLGELETVRVPNVVEGIMTAARQGKGGGIAGRLMKALGGGNKLSVHEFLYYRLFDPALPKDEIGRFVSAAGRDAQTKACNDEAWREPTFDKVVWDNHLERGGLPRPRIIALHRTEATATDARMLDDREALVAFLKDPASYPLLAKPNLGGRSIGLLRMDGLDGDRIRIHDGSARPVEDVAEFLNTFGRGGYIFQEVLQPHPDIAAVTGGTLATMRVVILNKGPEPVLENITLKLPRTGSVADNFWRTGNMLAAVRTKDGVVRRVVLGSGTELQEVGTHPDTGADLAGFRIPDLDAVREFARAAAGVFPGLGLQGWDLALTDRGPVPVELNYGGDVNLQQLAHHRGAMTPAYCENLRQAGYTGYLPG